MFTVSWGILIYNKNRYYYLLKELRYAVQNYQLPDLLLSPGGLIVLDKGLLNLSSKRAIMLKDVSTTTLCNLFHATIILKI